MKFKKNMIFLSIFLYLFYGMNNYLLASAKTKTKIPKNEITFMITLIWDGHHVLPANISAIKEFRKNFPDVKMTHMISPVYFVKSTLNIKDMAQQIKSVIQTGDTVGLYLQPWKTLVEGARIKFRTTPTFWGNELDLKSCLPDCGNNIPLSAYNKSEITKLIQYSIEIFKKNNFAVPNHFMAGGWMAPPHVIEVVGQNGFTYDMSGIPASLVKNKLDGYPIFKWLSRFYKNIKVTSQPTIVQTSKTQLVRIYHNLGAVDYQTEEDIFANYLENVKDINQKSKLVTLSFFQETSWKYHMRLQKSFERIIKHASENKINISYYEAKPKINLPEKKIVQSSEEKKKGTPDNSVKIR